MIYLHNKDQQDASCWSLSHKFHEGTEVGSNGVPLLTTLTLEGGGWSIPCLWPLYSQERNLIPMVQEAWWVTGSIWMDAEILPH